MTKLRVLLTGGAGYIGSHTYIALKEAGHEPLIFDSFVNASRIVIARLGALFQQAPTVIEADIRDNAALAACFDTHKPDAVIHFAGAKAVGESVENPLKYYDNNVHGSQVLLSAMGDAGIKKIVFSSSATVYGVPQKLPLTEDHPLSSTNPYGHTKLVVEDMLRALYGADPAWSISILRYFNPVGAHSSGHIGEDPKGIPNNLMPYIAQVAVGRRPHLNVFGNDYETPDGTGVRDYIHVADLAAGHLAALNLLSAPQCQAINLGTGQGYSVLELADAFAGASGRDIPRVIQPRRSGDVAACYADPRLAKDLLGWQAMRGLDEMCMDSWRWQSQNPNGFED